MSFTDSPEATDAEKILAALDKLNAAQLKMNERLNGHADAINGLGMNMEWLVGQAKQLFQALPAMMNPAMMETVMKGMAQHGGQDRPADGPAADADE
jgi:hypothetical protein